MSFYNLSTLTWHIVGIDTVEGKEPIIIHNQNHGFWWPGDARSNGISSHGIDLVLTEYFGFNTEWLTQWAEQNGRHFGNIFKCIFLNGNYCILIKFSMKFVRKGMTDNKSRANPFVIYDDPIHCSENVWTLYWISSADPRIQGSIWVWARPLRCGFT